MYKTLPMKRYIIVGSIVLCCAVTLLRLAGGIHYNRFTRYLPTSAASIATESEFKPSLHPEFSRISSPRNEILIPSLLYRHAEADREPHIYLQILREGQPGFRGNDTLTIESLSVQCEFGFAVQLIEPLKPRSFRLASDYISRREDLGAFEGDALNLQAEGYITNDLGDKKQFKHWRIFSVKE